MEPGLGPGGLVGAQLTLCRQTLDVDSFGRQETEAGVNVLDLDRETDTDTVSCTFPFNLCIFV